MKNGSKKHLGAIFEPPGSPITPKIGLELDITISVKTDEDLLLAVFWGRKGPILAHF